MDNHAQTEERPTGPAVMNGLRQRCPCCGKGRLFGQYLKVVEACAECGTELKHHRADDGPAYLTITVVGHLVIFVMMLIWDHVDMSPLWMSILLSVVAICMSLWMLPKMKGLMVAIQWAKRMYGFGKL